MILETKLQLGATAPFSLVHLSDTHLAHPDTGDLAEIPEKVRLADPTIPTPAERLARAVQLSQEHGAQIVHTGDLTDFVSAANLEHAKRFVSENGCFVAAGNHEFRGYQDHSFEDAATMETLEWIRREPLFRAVLAGHIHCNCECRLSAELPQYVISKNDLRLVHIC